MRTATFTYNAEHSHDGAQSSDRGDLSAPGPPDFPDSVSFATIGEPLTVTV